MVDSPALRDLAAEIATEAGELLLQGLHRERESVGSKSSATDMITEMDRAAEDLIVTRLRARRPGDGLVGEEGTSEASSTGVTWVIDPLDGTTNYLYRLPAFAVSVAAEVDRKVVAGVVHNPVIGETYAAALGHGATLNGEPLLLTGPPPALSSALVATGFGYDANARRAQAEVVATLIGWVRDIRRFGSAALDFCSVAAGRVDAYFEEGTKRWDRAAGELVATEAGVTVGNLAGPGRPDDEMSIAAHPALFDEFRQLLIRSRR